MNPAVAHEGAGGPNVMIDARKFGAVDEAKIASATQAARVARNTALWLIADVTSGDSSEVHLARNLYRLLENESPLPA